jgi:Flp pilus assembly protein TadD
MVILTVLLLSGCSLNRFHSDFDFGNKLAESGLWKEAMYRWQISLQAGENTAALHNNLAIGYEHDGQFDRAEAEYQLALKLAPQNEVVLENYKRFKRVLKHDFTRGPEDINSDALRRGRLGG